MCNRIVKEENIDDIEYLPYDNYDSFTSHLEENEDYTFSELG